MCRDASSQHINTKKKETKKMKKKICRNKALFRYSLFLLIPFVCMCFRKFADCIQNKVWNCFERNCTNTDESKTFFLLWNPWGQHGKYVCSQLVGVLFCFLSSFFLLFVILISSSSFFIFFIRLYIFVVVLQSSLNESFKTLVQIFG